MLTFIAAICIFLVVVLIHELGHFIVAKLVGIKVNEFSIGMGPKLYQSKKGETKYTIRGIPMGGYVSMEGEDEGSNDPRSFNNAPVLGRIGVIVAGPIMNFILAIFILTVVAFGIGTPTREIKEVMKDSPAYYAELKTGDIIKFVNNKEMKSWQDIVSTISVQEPEKEVKLLIDRSGKDLELSILPIKEGERSIIGIKPSSERSFIGSIKSGFLETKNFLISMFQFIGMLFKGRVTTDNLSGPVGVVKEIGNAAQLGIYTLLYLMGFISINLGFFNLLPIPALDGGRLVFLIVELFRGKAIDPDKEGAIHLAGFLLLIGLMLFVTYKDIIKLIIKG